jgi:23S rRNA pseudouridine1911/1915/1917 synthase
MVPMLKIGNHDKGERLDAVLARTYPQYSRVFFQKFMKRGGVTLAGALREPSYRVRVGEVYQVADFETFGTAPAAKQGPDVHVDTVPAILFEDAALLVIDKPAGLVVHPAPGHRVGTLMDWLKGHLGSAVSRVFTDPERLGLVHRLDKDTSGVLVIAKSVLAQTAISRQFHDRTVQKTYAAFVEGVPSSKTGVINAPVGRSRKVATRMAISPLGRSAETVFEVKESLKEVSIVTLHPKTGRTHQLRVHLSAIGHPIVGDRTYGAKSIWPQTYQIHRPLLHAERLTIQHPTRGKPMTFEAPWPADFHRARELFRGLFKLLLIGLAIAPFLTAPASAEEETRRTAGEASTRRSGSGSSTRTSSLSSDVRRLKRDMETMKETIDSIKDSLDKANAGDRLRDLERAVADLNSKAASTTVGSEDSKTQLMDMSRKIKSLQESLEQIRDQLDRVKGQLIQQQATGAPAPAPAPRPAAK